MGWSFSTENDGVAPTIQSRNPGPNTVGVPTSSTIEVVFSERVMNVTAASFTVNDGAAVTGTLATPDSGVTWVFTPSAALASGATVTVTLTAAITDLATNPLAATSYMFTTQ